jgi:THO complex subunit 4
MASQVDPLSVSLDDLIAQQRKKRPSSGGRPAATAGRQSRDGRGRGGRRDTSERLKVVVQNDFKPRRGGSRGGRPRQANAPREPAAPRNYDQLEGGAKWTHDQFSDEVPVRRTNLQNRLGGAASGTRLEVTNLEYSVSEADIQELFATVGPLKKSGIKFDASGRSTGEAFAIFENKADAEKAIARYNNVALDGKPMHLRIAEQPAGGRLQDRLSDDRQPSRTGIQFPGTFQRAVQGARLRSNGGGSGSGGRGGRQTGKMQIDTMDLDTELADYMAARS